MFQSLLRIAVGQQEQNSAGFTLIELMVTVVVVAVMAALAAPSMVQFIYSARLSSAANQFQADLQIARREAIKRNAHVLMCPGTTAGACGTGSDWSSGWLVCYDNSAPLNTCDSTVTADPNPLRVHGAVDSSITVKATSACPGGTATALSAPVWFDANGSQGASGATTIVFTVTGTWSGAKTYCVSIAGTGSITMIKPS
jgi:prepilin-type N-terminal cleavage/methylation domain-containing protein